MTESTTLRVIYGDTDQMGVVYYGNYLRYFEIGRAEWLRARGHTYKLFEEAGYLLPVVEATLRYRSPARYDDLLTIDATPIEVKSASLRFEYRVHRGDQLLVEGSTRHACLRREGGVAPFPPEIVAVLRGESR